jgi:hypothetical protein
MTLAMLVGSGTGWGAANGTVIAVLVFAGISAALYRIVRSYRYGWAIAATAAPILAVLVLLIVAALL